MNNAINVVNKTVNIVNKTVNVVNKTINLVNETVFSLLLFWLPKAKYKTASSVILLGLQNMMLCIYYFLLGLDFLTFWKQILP